MGGGAGSGTMDNASDYIRRVQSTIPQVGGMNQEFPSDVFISSGSWNSEDAAERAETRQR